MQSQVLRTPYIGVRMVPLLLLNSGPIFCSSTAQCLHFVFDNDNVPTAVQTFGR